MITRDKLLPLVALVASSGLLSGCAASVLTIDTSVNAEVSFDGLYPVEGVSSGAAWAREGVDFS